MRSLSILSLLLAGIFLMGCDEQNADDADVNDGDIDDADVDGEVDCSAVGCAQAPICGQECDFVCGCCNCSAGETSCVATDDGMMFSTCSENGDCYEATPCDGGCIDTGPGEQACTLQMNCEETEAALLAHLETSNSCQENEDCETRPGICMISEISCWYAIPASTSTHAFDAIVARRTELECPTGDCDCDLEPSARCDNGDCVLDI